MAPELGHAAEIFKELNVRLVDTVEVFKIFKRVFDETQRRHKFAVLSLSAANRVAKRIIFVNFYAVRFKNAENFVKVKTLQRRSAEYNDVFVVQRLKPPADVVKNAVDGFFNFRCVTLVDSVDRDKQRIEFVIFRESLTNLAQKFNFIVGEVVGIIHDENADVRRLNAFFGNFLVLSAGAGEIRARRVPDFVAVQVAAGIVNHHVAKFRALAGMLLRFFKFVADKFAETFRAVKSPAPAVVVQNQFGIGFGGNVLDDVRRGQFRTRRSVVTLKQAVNDNALAGLFRTHRGDSERAFARFVGFFNRLIEGGNHTSDAGFTVFRQV